MAETRLWFFPAALGRGYPLPVVERVWQVIEAFASFGFCKAHAAAFALPTYQSAWLKAHWPAHFLAGVLTHDPGMYPKRLILEDARQCGIAILGLDVNASEKAYVVERMSSLDEPPPIVLGETSRPDPTERGWPDGRAWGIRLALAEVKGINAGEVERIVSSRALPLADRLLAPRPGVPADRRTAGAGRWVRLPLRARLHHRVARRRPPPYQGHPSRPAAPGGRARPARPRGPAGRPGARPGRRPGPVRGDASGRHPGRGGRSPRQHRPDDA